MAIGIASSIGAGLDMKSTVSVTNKQTYLFIFFSEKQNKFNIMVLYTKESYTTQFFDLV